MPRLLSALVLSSPLRAAHIRRGISRTSPCASSCPSRRVNDRHRRDSSAPNCRRYGASRSSSRTVPARAAASARTPWPRARRTATRCSWAPSARRRSTCRCTRKAAASCRTTRSTTSRRSPTSPRCQRHGGAATSAGEPASRSSSTTPARARQAQHGLERQRHLDPHGRRTVQDPDQDLTWSTCRIAARRRRCTDLIAGNTQVMFDNLPVGAAAHRSGRLKALAVTSTACARRHCPACRRWRKPPASRASTRPPGSGCSLLPTRRARSSSRCSRTSARSSRRRTSRTLRAAGRARRRRHARQFTAYIKAGDRQVDAGRQVRRRQGSTDVPRRRAPRRLRRAPLPLAGRRARRDDRRSIAPSGRIR